MSQDVPSPNEIVIVRRRGGGHDDAHHGGAWKIAFADFMTALMCFFLVMWLINSTDKNTVTQIASYFNPLRLNDRLPSKKGVQEQSVSSGNPKESGSDGVNKKEKKEKKENKPKKPEPVAQGPSTSEAGGLYGAGSDIEVLRDPIGTIEAVMASGAATSAATGKRSLPIGMPLDAFDSAVEVGLAGDGYGRKSPPVPESKPGTLSVRRDEGTGGRVGGADRDRGSDEQPAPRGIQQGKDTNSSSLTPADTKSKEESANKVSDSVRKDIAAALADLKPESRPVVEVTSQMDGITISVADNFEFGMFSVGSARPSREMVVVMERISAVLARQAGEIRIVGHTDGRKYRTADNDNWRLSSARAQMAFYMMRRAGIEEGRVVGLEGRADTAPKVPDDSLDSRNRRIDIQLLKTKP